MDQNQLFNGTNTNFLYNLDEGGDYEDILSDLRSYDTESSDIPQASNNAVVSAFSSATSQQDKRQQSRFVRLTPQLPPVLVSEDSIPSAGGCFENAPKDAECEPSHGTSYMPAHASGQSSSSLHVSHKSKLCGMRFTKTEELYRHKHINEGQLYQCKTCQKVFMTKYNFKRHLTVHSNERPYQCEICGKTFKLKQSFMIHYRQKHTGKK